MNALYLVTYESNFYLKQIESLERRGVEITSMAATTASTREKSNVRAILDGVPLIDSDEHSPLAYFLHASMFYPKVLKESISEYDVVHANSGMTAPFAIAQPNRPIVLTLWGSDLMGDRVWGRYPEFLKWCSKYYDAVIVQNKEMEKVIPHKNIQVIPSGVDFEQFSPMDQIRAQEKLGWDTDKKHVFWPYPKQRTVKNWSRAEQVMKCVQDQYNGDVEFKAKTGIDYIDMPTYYNASDVLLLTSYREGSPNTVKEALACNTPVVSTDVGDVCERVEGVHGSRVCSSDQELIDGVLEALDTDTCNGREMTRELSWESVSEEILQIYREVKKS